MLCVHSLGYHGQIGVPREVKSIEDSISIIASGARNEDNHGVIARI